MLSNLFLLDLNENLEPYIFGLIQSAKINKTGLFIEDMIIALVDHDKRSNDEEGFSFKSMIVYHHVKRARRKLDDKSLKCQFLSYEEVNQFRL